MIIKFLVFQILVGLGAVHASGSSCDADAAAAAIKDSNKNPNVTIQYWVPADSPCREQINTAVKKAMGQPLVEENHVFGSGNGFDDFVYSLMKGPCDELYANFYKWGLADVTRHQTFLTAVWLMIDNRQKFLSLYKQKYGKDPVSQGQTIFAFKEMWTGERKPKDGNCDVQKWISEIDKEIKCHCKLEKNATFSAQDIPLTVNFFTQESFDCISKVAAVWPASHNKTIMSKSIFLSIPPMKKQMLKIMVGAIGIGQKGPAGIGALMQKDFQPVPEFIPFFVYAEKVSCQLKAAYDEVFLANYSGQPSEEFQGQKLNQLLNSIKGSPSIDMIRALLQQNGNCYNPNEH